jgi:hypothetical protein
VLNVVMRFRSINCFSIAMVAIVIARSLDYLLSFSRTSLWRIEIFTVDRDLGDAITSRRGYANA